MDDESTLQKTLAVATHDDVVYVNFIGQVIDESANVRRAELAVDALYEIFKANPGKIYKVLVNMTTMGESHISAHAQKVYLKALKEGQISKVAIVGNFKKQLKVLSFITPFIVGEGKKVSWFSNEAEARLWFEKIL